MECLKFMEDVFTNHVILRLTENCKKYRDNKNFVGNDVLLDLSKAFNCIPHDLLAEKLHAYDLSEDALTLCIRWLAWLI